jgi:hypothetical protein
MWRITDDSLDAFAAVYPRWSIKLTKAREDARSKFVKTLITYKPARGVNNARFGRTDNGLNQ